MYKRLCTHAQILDINSIKGMDFFPLALYRMVTLNRIARWVLTSTQQADELKSYQV